MSDQWRTLSPGEIHTTAGARLSGPLAIVLWSALAIALAPIVAMLAITILAGPDFLLFWAGMTISGLESNSLGQIAVISFIPQFALYAWAAVTAIMGFSRNASTPRTSSVLLIIWAALAVICQIAVRFILVSRSGDILSEFSLAPYIIFDVAVAAAYWGYMHDGHQPNIYFRRRVRA